MKSGSWYSFKDERIGQGKEKVRLFLKQNPELCKEIEAVIRANKDALIFAPSKGNKAAIIEVRKGAAVSWNGTEFISAIGTSAKASGEDDEEVVERETVSDPEGSSDDYDSGDDLTDIEIDVEADLDDFE